MRRGGLTRLIQHVGITLVILELAHVPLPSPESDAHRHRIHPGEACPAEGGPIHWRWAALDLEEDDDAEALDLAAFKSDSQCCSYSKCSCDLTASARPRPRAHYVRGHSKGLAKALAGPSTFVGLADASDAGFHPLANDGSNAPRAAMLQRWRC